MLKYDQTALLTKIKSTQPTSESQITVAGQNVPVLTGEFWTAKQRQGIALHEISYRACFKAELPEFFIELLTAPQDIVFDPFCGRGTTPLQASLMGRIPYANDLNPLSIVLVRPRLHQNLLEIKTLEKILTQIPRQTSQAPEINLDMFYHPATLQEIMALRQYLTSKSPLDFLDQWLQMVAVSRLSGHSKGFFSVYTLPPNQAVSPERQLKINQKLNQKPEYRDTHELILKKTKTLLRGMTPLYQQNQQLVAAQSKLLTEPADQLSLGDHEVDLTVTSPPFLDVVQYAEDNWLRCWFLNLNPQLIEQTITQTKTLPAWKVYQLKVIQELFRVTKPAGWVAFEVGEVKQGKIDLMPHVVELAFQAGFEVPVVLIHKQDFTKTANIWGVKNNAHGTNTNRIIVMRKPA